MLTRRAALGGLAGVVATAATGAVIVRRSRGSGSESTVVRIGAMSNLTHTPMLAGLGSGRIARALHPLTVESRIFRAGPRVTEALIGNAIDVGTAGPAAIVVHHARHFISQDRGEREPSNSGANGLRILTGCCSGGASLVVTRASKIENASDLRHKRVAVTQIGTTQDIALRMYLTDAGLRDAASGGDVTVLAIAGATILDQMRRGDLHAAWLPEPWATRIVSDLNAIRLVDERDLWPNRRFSTAMLVAHARDEARGWVPPLVHALEEEVARAVRDPHSSLLEAHSELKRHVGNPGPFAIFEKAARWVDFTSDPIPASVERFGDAAASFGLCPKHPAQGLFSSDRT